MKRLSPEEFDAAAARLNLGEQTIKIARAVLVDGRRQKEFVEEMKVSPGAVSQAVSRVWNARDTGLVRVTAMLPPFRAFIVKQWEKEAQGK